VGGLQEEEAAAAAAAATAAAAGGSSLLRASVEIEKSPQLEREEEDECFGASAMCLS